MKTMKQTLYLGFLILSSVQLAYSQSFINKKKLLTPAPENSFSIVVIPDTQEYLGKGTKKEPDSKDSLSNAIFRSQTEWIADNIDRQRIAFVSHVGDIVDKNNEDQWTLARQCLDVIHGLVPYGLSVGNHDMTRDGNSVLFQKYFPAARFESFKWYGGYFGDATNDSRFSGNNANSYQLFTAGGIDFIILHLECSAPDNVLEWADERLNQFKDRFAIITTHMVLGPIEKPKIAEGFFNDPKGIANWAKNHEEKGNSPQEMWEKLFTNHRHLKLIFCGDQSRTNVMYTKQFGRNSNRVDILLSDYMQEPGPLRIYRFFPQKNEIEVISFNTLKDEIAYNTEIVPEPEMHNFKLSVNFQSFLKN